MEDKNLKQILEEELARIKTSVLSYEKELQGLPKGYISFKNVKGKKYPYYQYRDGVTVRSAYINNEKELEGLQKAISRRKEIEQAIKRSSSNRKSIETALKIKEKPSYTSRQIMNLSNLIANTVHPEKIILFGSYAYGKPTSKSDVDLMVVMKDPALSDEDKIDALHKIYQRRIKSSNELMNTDISIVARDDLDARINDTGSAIFDALRKGKIIYDHNVQKGRVIR